MTARVKVNCHFCGVTVYYEADFWKKRPEKKPDWAKKRDQDKPPTVPPTGSPSQDMETDQAPKDRKQKRSTEVLRFLKPQPRIFCLLMICVLTGKETNALIDSGTSMFGVLYTSFMTRDMPQLDPSTTTLIKMGDGKTSWSLGEAFTTVQVGKYQFQNPFQVIDTSSFEVVLGMGFLSQCDGILMKPYPTLVIEGEEIRLEAMRPRLLQLHVQHVRHESYRLVDHLREQRLRCLLGMEKRPRVDLFSSTRNATETVHISRQMDSWTWNWKSLYEEGSFLCANPPFSKMGRVVAKSAMEPLRIVLLRPDWNSD